MRLSLHPQGRKQGKRALIACSALGLALSLLLGCGSSEEAVLGEDGGLEAGAVATYDYAPPEPRTYELPVIKPAGDGMVLNSEGSPLHLTDLLRGKITLLSFVYTRCADATACPLASGTLSKIHEKSSSDSSLATTLQLVTFSFDPDHDTPNLMASYRKSLMSASSGSDWIFLTTSDSKILGPILEEYGQRVDLKKDPCDPLGPLNHLLRLYLIDPEGMIRNIYSSGMMDSRLLMADIRTLILEMESS